MKTKLLLIIFGISVLWACNSAVAGKKEDDHVHGDQHAENTVILNKNQVKALGLKFGTFQMRNLTTVVKTTGQLAVPPESQAEVTAVIGGNVKEIHVFYGDYVRKGQVLAVLEHPDYIQLQEEFAKTASELEFLRQDYERQKQLFENGATPAKKFQQAKAKYFATKARYEGLQRRLLLLNLDPGRVKQGEISALVTVKAPIDGYISKVNVKVGSYVAPDAVMFVITDNNDIHADLLVYEKDVYLVKKDQTVHFTVANRPDKELEGKIFAVEKEFDPDIRAIHVHAKIFGDKTGLIPGMYITGHIHTDSIYTRTLPNDVIVREGTKYYIFVLDDHTAEKHKPHGQEHEEDHDHQHETDQDHENDGQVYVFRMVEIIPGKQDDGFTEVKLLQPLDPEVKIVLNKAYYLLADLKKEETEHSH